jgi:hypothetical protein
MGNSSREGVRNMLHVLLLLLCCQQGSEQVAGICAGATPVVSGCMGFLQLSALAVLLLAHALLQAGSRPPCPGAAVNVGTAVAMGENVLIYICGCLLLLLLLLQSCTVLLLLLLHAWRMLLLQWLQMPGRNSGDSEAAAARHV